MTNSEIAGILARLDALGVTTYEAKVFFLLCDSLKVEPFALLVKFEFELTTLKNFKLLAGKD